MAKTNVTAVMVMGINISNLSCKELGRQLTAMDKAVNGAQKCAWDFAKATAKIFNGELYKEDFTDKKDFAERVNLSPARITQCTKAVQFITSKGLTSEQVKLDNAYCLNSISKKATIVNDKGKQVERSVDDYDGFVSYIISKKDMTEKDLFQMPNAKLKDLITEYKDDRDCVYTVEAKESESESETETETETTADVMDSINPYYTIGRDADGDLVLVMHFVNAEPKITKYGKPSADSINALMIEFNKQMSALRNGFEKLDEAEVNTAN